MHVFILSGKSICTHILMIGNKKIKFVPVSKAFWNWPYMFTTTLNMYAPSWGFPRNFFTLIFDKCEAPDRYRYLSKLHIHSVTGLHYFILFSYEIFYYHGWIHLIYSYRQTRHLYTNLLQRGYNTPRVLSNTNVILKSLSQILFQFCDWHLEPIYHTLSFLLEINSTIYLV